MPYAAVDFISLTRVIWTCGVQAKVHDLLSAMREGGRRIGGKDDGRKDSGSIRMVAC